MRLLICGGTEFVDKGFAFDTLDRFHALRPVTHVIHGDAPGADKIGEEWAIAREIPFTAYPAHWDLLRMAAGPARNAQMLREGKPDEVFALPGHRGTMNMVGQAKEAGVPVTFATRI
jgi:hypothetical protein